MKKCEKYKLHRGNQQTKEALSITLIIHNYLPSCVTSQFNPTINEFQDVKSKSNQDCECSETCPTLSI